MAVIAKIELMPNTGSWYDALTNIYLNYNHPKADVTSDMDLSTIKRGLIYKTIRVYEGEITTSSNNDSSNVGGNFDTEAYYTKAQVDYLIKGIECDFNPELYHTKTQIQDLIKNQSYDFDAYT